MPDPREYIDGEHQYVKGYVRRKQGYGTEYERRSWFWRLAWYWRLSIFIIVFAVFIVLLTVSFTSNIYILFAAIGIIVFLVIFFRLVKK